MTFCKLCKSLFCQNGDAHPFRFRLKTIDRVYRFAVDTAGWYSWNVFIDTLQKNSFDLL